jgi:type 1 glutamine amidotransferase
MMDAMKSLSVPLLAVCFLLGFNAPSGAQPKPPPLKVCLVSGSLEYDSDASFAVLQKYLETHYQVVCTRAFRKTDNDLPGLENLDTCDVMVLYTRRLTISGEQLERVKKYCLAGKPLVGIRTASHAFQNWLDLDKEVLGGNYKNHYKAGSATQVEYTAKGKNHPILAGVKLTKSEGTLYKNTGLAKDVDILLTGSIPMQTEPIAWTRLYKGARIFYTSLGHQKDFEDENYLRMLANALFWTTQKKPLAIDGRGYTGARVVTKGKISSSFPSSAWERTDFEAPPRLVARRKR